MPADRYVPFRLASAECNRTLLEQGAAALERLSCEQYSGARARHSSVGAQFRHILDHYAALFEGIARGRVNYDARERDRTLEQDPAAAVAAARCWIVALEGLDAGVADRHLVVHSDSGDGPGALDWRESTVGRELQFLASHTVHHFALIKLLLEWHTVALDDEFGMAPSTRAHMAATR
jgi:uncharacterized damage-inducible protein DinB